MTENSPKKTPVLAIVAIVGLLALGFAFFRWFRGELVKDTARLAAQQQARPAETVAADPGAPDFEPRAERRPGTDPITKDSEAVDYLREQFGATITNKRTQIKALEKLIAYLMRQYPDDWQKRLEGLLAQAFPELASQLLAQYQNMSAYNEWLAANRTQLAEMDPAARRDALRDARFKYFGQDAAEIWEETFRHEQIYDAMDAISQTPDATVDQALDTYVDSIKQAYGDKAPQFLENRATELMTGFLGLGTVQDDLHAMTPEARARQLDTVRAKMGLDEAARQRWSDLDSQRDAAWETGERYMDERQKIADSFDGDEETRRLTELRGRMFGDEAETIQSEEAAGFFRFDHRRVYGRE
jgi:predicted metal-dependent hydrolase